MSGRHFFCIKPKVVCTANFCCQAMALKTPAEGILSAMAMLRQPAKL